MTTVPPGRYVGYMFSPATSDAWYPPRMCPHTLEDPSAPAGTARTDD
ncbi:hypothetical protein ACWDZ4_06415 [Streptomyces sp. NPDC003016]